ncbi:hypothetical protein GGR52DRAFT_447048 [Hypoxylon sp. FL1284]|nr:hypothetical protein GGR52DRAFT_447048 [Hypoxylon sp. FL1284]
MGIVNSARGWIDQAVKSVPQAAIAWTSVCFVLEVLANPLDEAIANREGIVYVVSRMNWYWNLSRFLEETNEKSSGLRRQMENRIIDLYKNLLSYQMKTTCSCHRNWFVVSQGCAEA